MGALDRYLASLSSGRSSSRSLDKYRRGIQLDAAAEEENKPGFLPSVFNPIRDAVGGVLDATSAGVGAVAGLAAKAMGSDVYTDVLQEKLAVAQADRAARGLPPLEIKGDLTDLTLAPKFGELATHGWVPESKGAQDFKDVVSLASTMGTDPATYTPKGIANIYAAASKARKPYELAKGFIGASKPLTRGGVAREVAEGAFGTVAPAAIYAPDIVRGVYEGVKSIGEAESAGDVAGASAKTLLMSGLGLLMGKGLTNEYKAYKTLKADLTGRVEADEAEGAMPERTPEVDEMLAEDEGVPSVFSRRDALKERMAREAEGPERVFYQQPDGPMIEGVAGQVPRVFYGGRYSGAQEGEVGKPPVRAIRQPNFVDEAVDEVVDAGPELGYPAGNRIIQPGDQQGDVADLVKAIEDIRQRKNPTPEEVQLLGDLEVQLANLEVRQGLETNPILQMLEEMGGPSRTLGTEPTPPVSVWGELPDPFKVTVEDFGARPETEYVPPVFTPPPPPAPRRVKPKPAPPAPPAPPADGLAALDAFEAEMAAKYGTPTWHNRPPKDVDLNVWEADVNLHDAYIARANAENEAVPAPVAAKTTTPSPTPPPRVPDLTTEEGIRAEEDARTADLNQKRKDDPTYDADGTELEQIVQWGSRERSRLRSVEEAKVKEAERAARDAENAAADEAEAARVKAEQEADDAETDRLVAKGEEEEAAFQDEIDKETAEIRKQEAAEAAAEMGLKPEDLDEIEKLSLSGMRAREVGAQMGIPDSAVRKARIIIFGDEDAAKEAVKKAAAVRFAKPATGTTETDGAKPSVPKASEPAPSTTPKNAPGSTQPEAPALGGLDAALAFLKGKASVTEADLKAALSDALGKSSLKVQQTLQQLNNLGHIKDKKGKVWQVSEALRGDAKPPVPKAPDAPAKPAAAPKPAVETKPKAEAPAPTPKPAVLEGDPVIGAEYVDKVNGKRYRVVRVKDDLHPKTGISEGRYVYAAQQGTGIQGTEPIKINVDVFNSRFNNVSPAKAVKPSTKPERSTSVKPVVDKKFTAQTLAEKPETELPPPDPTYEANRGFFQDENGDFLPEIQTGIEIVAKTLKRKLRADFDDILDWARSGVSDAIRLFNPAKGTALGKAKSAAQTNVYRELSILNSQLASPSTLLRIRMLRSISDDLIDELGRAPTVSEVAARAREAIPEMEKIRDSTVARALNLKEESTSAFAEAFSADAAPRLKDLRETKPNIEEAAVKGVGEEEKSAASEKFSKAVNDIIDKHTEKQPPEIREHFRALFLRGEKVKAKDVSKVLASQIKANRRGESAITAVKKKIEADIAKLADDPELGPGIRALLHMADDLVEPEQAKAAMAAEAAGWMAPVKTAPGLHVLQTSDVHDGVSAEIADSPEMGKFGRAMQRIQERIEKSIGSKSKMFGFVLTRGLTGLHTSIKTEGPGRWKDGRIYINPFFLAEYARKNSKGFLPHDGRPGDLADRIIGTLFHEHAHNQLPHGPEFNKVQEAYFTKMLDDGTTSAIRNDLVQMLSANDNYMYKWLVAKADEVKANATAEPTKVAPIRDAGTAGSTAKVREPGGDQTKAGDSAERGAGSEGTVRSGEPAARGGVASVASLLRGESPSEGGIVPSPARVRAYMRTAHAKLADDPDAKKLMTAFTDASLKDMDPIELLKMAPVISPKITSEVAKQLLDAWNNPDAYLAAHPEAVEGSKGKGGRAKPGGDPDIALNLLRLDIDPELKKQFQVFYHILEPLQLRAQRKPWISDEDLLTHLSTFKNNRDLFNHAKKFGINEEDLAVMRTVEMFNGAELNNARSRMLLMQAQIDADATKGVKTSDALISAHQVMVKEVGVRALIQAQMATDLSGHKTRVARVLSSMRKPVTGNWDPHMQNASAMGKFLYALEQQGVPKDVREQLWKLLQMDTKDAMDAFKALLRENQNYTRWQKFAEYYTAGLVSGFPTKMANLTSNAAFRVARDIENTLAVGIDRLRFGTDMTKRTRFIGETSAWMSGYMSQLPQAIKNWQQSHAEILMGKALSRKEGLKFLGGTSLDVAKQTGLISGMKGEILRTGYKSMEADDDFFKHIAGAGELYKLLYRHARIEGLTHEQARKAMQTSVDAIMKADAEDAIDKLPQHLRNILKAVDKAARADTFQGDLHGTVPKEFAHKIQLISNVHPMLKLIVPFVRTPANILSETMKRTPMGLVNIWRKRALMEQGEIADELSKSILGSIGAMSVAYIAYSQAVAEDPAFEITGQGPLDARVNAELKATGWQPYSIKIGNRYIPYQRYEPFSSLLGMAADMAESVKNGETKTPEKLAKRMMSSMAKNLTNKTFLAGISNLVEAWHEPERNLDFFIQQMEQSLVPMSGLSRNIARVIDPTYRETDMTTAAVAAVPGASLLLPPQYDPTGQPRQRAGSVVERMVMPGATTVEDDTPKGNLIRKMAEIGYAPRIDEYIRTKKFGKQDLTPDQVAVLARARVMANKQLEGIVDNPAFQALPDNDEDPAAFGGRKTKRDVLEKVHKKYYQAALRRLYPEIARKAISERQS